MKIEEVDDHDRKRPVQVQGLELTQSMSALACSSLVLT